MKILFWFILSSTLSSKGLLETPSFTAEYQITRNDKIIATQKTTFKYSDSNYILTDQTRGTHGMASLTGFERNETSEGILLNSTFKVLKHRMQQKVLFSKKSYQFSWQKKDDQYLGSYKKQPFTVKSPHSVISSHMMPIQLAQLACQGATQASFYVLKNKKAKQYQFTIERTANGLLKSSRVYPLPTQKKTESWLDPQQNCLTIKTRHQDTDEVIETSLINIKLLTLANPT